MQARGLKNNAVLQSSALRTCTFKTLLLGSVLSSTGAALQALSQDQEIGEILVFHKRRVTDFKAPKL